MRSRGGFRSLARSSAVRSCSSSLFIHISAPAEARRVRGGRAQTRRVQQQQTTTTPEQQRMEGPESFPLDFTAVESNMDNFMVQVKNSAQSSYPCSAPKSEQDMKSHLLNNVSVTCNDGSSAGYYIKESKGSRRWLSFSEGGWYCFNKQTCSSRYETMRNSMSSTKWPQSRRGTGISSPEPEENPHWWNANIVFIPYCSSDVWSGATPKTEHSDYAFMGSSIIKEVVKELSTKGSGKAKVSLSAGSSAGGTGVSSNVDHVAEQSQSAGHTGVQVRGLADSGWFSDNKQYKTTDCSDTISCAPTEAIKRGIRYWGGSVPESCRQAHLGEEWKCFFGYKVYPTLKSPLFVVQWLFDEAQSTVDNIHSTGQPLLEGQWRYIQNSGQESRSTLRDTTAMFAPACSSHELITRTNWMDIQVKSTSSPRASHCWDRSLQSNSHLNSSHGQKKHRTPPSRGCPSHSIDSCPWPHCNPSCPTIRDQSTGQEMSVLQFSKHMGFDVQKMAQQQGMDPRRSSGMLSNGS